MTTTAQRLATIATAQRATLDEAETVLDRIADSARAEAREFAVDPRRWSRSSTRSASSPVAS